MNAWIWLAVWAVHAAVYFFLMFGMEAFFAPVIPAQWRFRRGRAVRLFGAMAVLVSALHLLAWGLS